MMIMVSFHVCVILQVCDAHFFHGACGDDGAREKVGKAGKM